MLLDNKKNKAIKSHLDIFKTYKELKNILPFGYIKTRVSPGQKYSFKKQSILINLEKEKNKEISPTKITKNLFHNKNIYIFSEKNEKTKKLISSLKKYCSYNKPKKIFSIKSETNIFNDNQNNSYNTRNINNINNFILYANTLNNNKLNVDDNCKGNLNKNLSRNDNNIYPNNIRKCYRSLSINNCEMKNNIYLPSITNRLKNNLPRNQRQNSGFLLNGLGIKDLKGINANINNNNNLEKDISFNGIKIKSKKNINGPNYLLNYAFNNDKESERNIINKKNKKKNHKNLLYKKNLKIGNEIEIIGIKKKIKNV